eukprot:6193631-Pleurochrysis_carterae.AAC.7
MHSGSVAMQIRGRISSSPASSERPEGYVTLYPSRSVPGYMVESTICGETMKVFTYGRCPNCQETQVQDTQHVLENHTKTMSQQACKYRHHPNQSLAAHTGSATGSDHSLDAPVVCNVSSILHDCVGQIIKGPGVPKQVVPGLSWDALGALRCVSGLYATNTVVQSVSVLQPPMPGKTVNGQKKCVLSLVAQAKQGGAVLLDGDAAKWFSEDVRRAVLSLDKLGLDSAVGDQLADLELAAVGVC